MAPRLVARVAQEAGALVAGLRWRHLGFALLVPIFEVFRRITFSLPTALGSIASPEARTAALVCGCLLAGAAALAELVRLHPAELSARALVGAAAGAVGIALMPLALILGAGAHAELACALTVVSYALAGFGLAVLFLGWVSAFARVGTVGVFPAVCGAILLGNLTQPAIIACSSASAMAAGLAACFVLSGGTLFSLAFQKQGDRADAAGHPEAASVAEGEGVPSPERPKLPDIARGAASATAVGLVVCLFSYGIMAIPPAAYAQDHKAWVYVAGDLIACAVALVFARAARNDARFETIRHKTFFLLPVFAVFLAYFSFVRMLDASGTLKDVLSVGFNMSRTGFFALFVTVVALGAHEKGTCPELASAPALIGMVASFAAGALCYELLQANAMYVQVVITTAYILGLALISTSKASLNDEAMVEKRAGILSARCGLSARESEILHLVAAGYSVERIAEQLSISLGTVRTHVKHIYAKTGVHAREELMQAIRAAR